MPEMEKQNFLLKKSQSACGCLEPRKCITRDVLVQCWIWMSPCFLKNLHLFPERLTWEDWKFSREGGQHENSRADRDYYVYEMLRASEAEQNPFFHCHGSKKWTCQQEWFLGRGALLPSIFPSFSLKQIPKGKAAGLQEGRRGCSLFLSDVGWASSKGGPKVKVTCMLWSKLFSYLMHC